jgi:putative sugar O-methyltransferase
MEISKTYSAYAKVCTDAVNDDNLFNNFKRNSDYCEILEHQLKHLGQIYLDFILNIEPDILNNLPDDSFGNPVKYDYGEYLLSPTTLRYIYTYLDIKQHFGNKALNGSSIVEVGGGYGGQCVVLDKFYEVDIYTIYDLEPPCKLAEKYLKRAGVKALINTKSEFVNAEGYDFAISNYAFTELDRDVQEKYISFVFSNCNKGYLTLNTEQGLSYKEVKDRIPGSELVPGIFKNEYLLLWGY